MNKEIILEDGKYTIVYDFSPQSFTFKALRYGEEWRNLSGDKLILALIHRIEELTPMGSKELDEQRRKE
jgi:hypothetical protein